MNARRSRWRRSRFAFFELAVLLMLAGAAFVLGARSGAPLGEDTLGRLTPGCAATSGPNVLRIELAVPDRPGNESLSNLPEVLGCRDRTAVGEALRTSTQRDFVLIPVYVVLLLWCSARMGGLGGRDAERSEDPDPPKALPPEHPAHTRRGALLVRLDRRRSALALAGPELARREPRAEARRAIAAARDAEGQARWAARHARRAENLRFVDRWKARRTDRKAARQVRKEAVAEAKRVRADAVRAAAASGPGALVVPRGSSSVYVRATRRY